VSAEWLSAIAALATFLVILGSAIAALIQLRHMRGSNQITIITALRATLDLPEFQAAARFVNVELPLRLANPHEARRLAEMPPFADEYAALRNVANFWEGVGAFAKTGLIDTDLMCDIFGYMALGAWNKLAPIIATARVRANEPALWENFEYAAVLAQRYSRKHEISYPKNFPRMPVDTSLADRIAQWDAE
jgi:hypothetical protein